MYKKNHLSKTRQLAIQGKDIPDDEMTLLQNDSMILEITENEDDVNIDENLMRVINYVIRIKVFIGSHQDLSAKLNLPLTGKALQCLLKNNKDLLESNFINYEVGERNMKARQMKLTYFGDDDIDA